MSNKISNVWTSTNAGTVTLTPSATTASSITMSNNTWPPVSFPTTSESTGITFHKDGKEVFRFSSDLEAIEAMVQWIFENTTGRFYSLGTSRWYFELEEDAVAFKLVFKGHKLVDDSKAE